MDGSGAEEVKGVRKSARFAVRKVSMRKQNSNEPRSSSTNETEQTMGSKKRKRNGKETIHCPPKSRKKKQVVGYKCCPQMLYDLIRGLSDDQTKWVKELGFGALLLMKEVRIPKPLTLWLIDQVDWKRKCLCIRGRRFLLKDFISRALGIPNGELKVPLPKSGRGKSKIRNPTEEEKEYRASEGGRGMKVKDTIKALLAETDKNKFKKQFMLVLLCIYLAPTSGHFINRSYCPALVNIDQVKDMDWCEFVLSYLCDGIRDYRDSIATNVNVHGCVHLLCLMYIDIVTSPQITVPNGVTRVQCVTTELMELLESLDMKFDRYNSSYFGNLEINPDLAVEENYSEESEPASRGVNGSRVSFAEERPKSTPKRKECKGNNAGNDVNSSRQAKRSRVADDKPLPNSLEEIESAYLEKTEQIYQKSYRNLRDRLKKLDKRRKEATQAFMDRQLQDLKNKLTDTHSTGTSLHKHGGIRSSDTNLECEFVDRSEATLRPNSGNQDLDPQLHEMVPRSGNPDVDTQIQVVQDEISKEAVDINSENNDLSVDPSQGTSKCVVEAANCTSTTAGCLQLIKYAPLVIEKNPTPVTHDGSTSSTESPVKQGTDMSPLSPDRVANDGFGSGKTLASSCHDDVLQEVCKLAADASSEALANAAKDKAAESAVDVNSFGNLQKSTAAMSVEHKDNPTDHKEMEEQHELPRTLASESTNQPNIGIPDREPPRVDDSLQLSSTKLGSKPDLLGSQLPICMQVSNAPLVESLSSVSAAADSESTMSDGTDILDHAKNDEIDDQLIFVSPTYTIEELEVDDTPDTPTPSAPRDMTNVVPLTTAIPDGQFFVNAGSVNTAVKSRPKRIHKNEHNIEGIAECVKGTNKGKTAASKTYTEHVENVSLTLNTGVSEGGDINSTQGAAATKICIRGFHITEAEFVQSLLNNGAVGPNFMWLCCVAIMEDWGSRSKLIFNQTIVRELMTSPDMCKKDDLIRRLKKLPLKGVEQIYLPVPHGDQWILIVVNMVGRAVEIYDFSRTHKKGVNPFKDLWDKIGSNLQDTLSHAIGKDTPIYDTFSINCAQIHVQSNVNDSGFEVIRVLGCHNGKDLIGYGKKSMSVFRKEIAHTLVYHRFNDLNPTRAEETDMVFTGKALRF